MKSVSSEAHPRWPTEVEHLLRSAPALGKAAGFDPTNSKTLDVHRLVHTRMASGLTHAIYPDVGHGAEQQAGQDAAF